MAAPRVSPRQLSKHLRDLAAEAFDVTPDGDVLTKGEALAKLLWNKALGYSERVKDDEGRETEVVHKPEAWAIQLVYDRMEGRTPQALNEDADRIRAADRVSDLAKTRLNQLTASMVGTSNRPPPPVFKPPTKP
jgi:hypothetical protein